MENKIEQKPEKKLAISPAMRATFFGSQHKDERTFFKMGINKILQRIIDFGFELDPNLQRLAFQMLANSKYNLNELMEISGKALFSPLLKQLKCKNSEIIFPPKNLDDYAVKFAYALKLHLVENNLLPLQMQNVNPRNLSRNECLEFIVALLGTPAEILSKQQVNNNTNDDNSLPSLDKGLAPK